MTLQRVQRRQKSRPALTAIILRKQSLTVHISTFQIDASTCLFPEKTWFVKNIIHKTFPKAINRLIDAIVNNGSDFTVFSDPELPQYMLYDKEANEITPLVNENMNTDARYHVSFFEAFKKMWKCIFELIKRKFQPSEPNPEV